MVERILKFLRAMAPNDRLVMVRSWRPALDGDVVSWPLLLVEKDGLKMRRETVSRVWG